ncbi:MAG: hypothetical protein KTR16_11020 [Acidiferrobacterales bacterium]|nr:hypothetical protein [Acidiferrobacterales bacterium]
MANLTSKFALLFAMLIFSACDERASKQIEAATAEVYETEFVGSQACVSCHQNEFQQWQSSHHYQAMLEANSQSVLADFSEAKFEAHQVSYRFFTQQENDTISYWVELSEDSDEPSRYRIKYTFGFHPLQQYLVELEDGHIQALNMAWDSRAKQENGQRWFHLRPEEEMTGENIFHWQRHYQNWNSRCADCHSTGLQKNYQIEEHRYETSWSEINVACEACHGAGSEHIRLVQSQLFASSQTGFSSTRQRSLDWTFTQGSSIASPTPAEGIQSNEVDMCGACHSLRSVLSENNQPSSYHNQQRLQIMDDNAYFPDGQIKQETFVIGSFLQSKMHANGVTCANCHNPHSGAVLIEGNGLCLQCHSPVAYETTDHHQHQRSSEGSQCINCHMPARTYMEVDARRDHSFVVPNAKLSSALESPNACLNCHQDKDQNWLVDNLENSSTLKHWALLKRSLADGEDVYGELKAYLEESQPVMRRAALLTALADVPTQQSFDVAKQHLDSPDALIRRASLSALANMPSTVVLPNALSLIDDPVRSVRFQALSLLLPSYQLLSALEKRTIADVLAEYEQSLVLAADSPEGQLAIANLAVSQRDFEMAEQAYQRALRIEPNLLPALVNFADYYRATNRDTLGRELLEKALRLEPQNSGANFAYAMLLIRNQQKELAMRYLQVATQQIDSAPYYHYVYAVGLNDTGRAEQARALLTEALKKWPTDEGLQELSTQLSN